MRVCTYTYIYICLEDIYCARKSLFSFIIFLSIIYFPHEWISFKKAKLYVIAHDRKDESNLNFQSLELGSRYRDPQLQVTENLSSDNKQMNPQHPQFEINIISLSSVGLRR